jgi:hypothetical protein
MMETRSHQNTHGWKSEFEDDFNDMVAVTLRVSHSSENSQ